MPEVRAWSVEAYRDPPTTVLDRHELGPYLLAQIFAANVEINAVIHFAFHAPMDRLTRDFIGQAGEVSGKPVVGGLVNASANANK
ncbi:MAG: hypothetical protein P8Z76_07875 [Alphaproteobacteria bacterium]